MEESVNAYNQDYDERFRKSQRDWGDLMMISFCQERQQLARNAPIPSRLGHVASRRTELIPFYDVNRNALGV
jgi:hypothetical protein